MRKTKIVATLGPATDNPDVLRKMIKSGLDVARFNLSHGTHEEHLKRVTLFREVCNELGATVAMLGDTKGPEIRVGTFENGSIELVAGDSFVLTTNKVSGNSSHVSISYMNLPRDIKPGNRILIDDGLIELVAESATSTDITTRVVIGGKVSNRKGVNVPGVKLEMPFISAEDRADLRFFVENDFDLIAASFVRSAEDVNHLRDELKRINSKNNIWIVSKIENAEGVNNIDSILTVTDGIMVARGDLGVEVAHEELPIIQKDLIKKSVNAGKPVITATQMMESMVSNPRPTRAETSDVANAIYDGTSAIMLSGETAMGKYPSEALAIMSKIAIRIERDIDYSNWHRDSDHKPQGSITNAISHATVTVAHDLQTAAILAITYSGVTARNVAKFRPESPIIACTPDPLAQRQLKLIWGVTPLLTAKETDTSALFNHSVDAALKAGFVKQGDMIVLTAGVPIGYTGNTNMIKVHVVGEKIITI
jgi:pyruvate kinase